jgi:hypothetical protein
MGTGPTGKDFALFRLLLLGSLVYIGSEPTFMASFVGFGSTHLKRWFSGLMGKRSFSA